MNSFNKMITIVFLVIIVGLFNYSYAVNNIGDNTVNIGDPRTPVEVKKIQFGGVDVISFDPSTNITSILGFDPASGGGIDKWVPSHEYSADDVVWLADNNQIYVAISDHTSGSSFNPLLWNQLAVTDISGKLDKISGFSEDNRLIRTDGTGDTVQGSVVTLADNGAMSGITQLDVDSVRVDGYVISTTATDQALELNPNGTGTVDIPYLTNGAALFAGSNGAISQDFANYQYSTLDGLKVDNLNLNGNTISSTDTNGDIVLSPDGTGGVVVSTLTSGRVVYNDNGALVDDSQFSYNDATKVLRVDGIDIGGSNTITTHSGNNDLVLDAHGSGIVDVNAPINLESVTPNQVAFSDAISGNIVGSANFLYDPTVNKLRSAQLDFEAGVISTLPTTNQDISLSPNGTGDVTVTYGTNELSLDPSRHTGSLLRNPDFENEIVEFACTDATGDFEDATLDIPNNNRMFQMTVTDVGGYCDFVFNTDSRFVGLPFVVGALVQTELTDVDVCALVNGAEVGCSDVTAVTDIATGAYHNPYAIQKNAGGTSVGVRVKTTISSSGLVNVDRVRFDIDSLPTGSAISCSGDLDCNDNFSAILVGGTGADAGDVSSFNFDFLNDCDHASGNYTCTYKTTFQNPLECSVFGHDSSADVRSGKILTSTTTGLSFNFRNQNGDATINNIAVNVRCSKQGSDVKTIQQQGVVNVGTTQGARLQQNSNDLPITVSTTPLIFSINSADISEMNLFSIDEANNTVTALSAGRVEVFALFVAGRVTGQGQASLRMYVEINKGSGFVARENCGVAKTGSAGTTASLICNDDFTVEGGDVFRLMFVSNTTVNMQSDIGSVLRIRSVIDQQSVAASLATNYVSGGAEFITPDTWDGKPIYRRCYEVLSDITSTTTIDTIESGLKPIQAYTTGISGEWWVYLLTSAVSGAGQVGVRYTQSTGVLQAFVAGSWIVQTGTRFCFEYTKP